ncbi:MAG: PEP-CTERM sorting domain-containing protein [Acidobacteria bacterium]|nr:PEP-CTERM sorting domain-containing protein [Acidobacteriota bacterium]
MNSSRSRPLLILSGLLNLTLSGTSLSFTGSLDAFDPNDVYRTPVLYFDGGDLRIQTWSYGGGVNAAGAVVAPDGFAPYVSLFAGVDGNATFFASGFQGACPPAVPNPACYDVSVDILNVPAGSYIVALTTFPNMSFAENLGVGVLADGFIGFGTYYDPPPGSDTDRLPHFAFDVVVTRADTGDGTLSLVPEPSSAVLLGAAALGWLSISRTRNLIRKGPINNAK